VFKFPYLNILYYKEQLTRVTLQTKSITKEGWRHLEANLNHPTIQQWQTMWGLWHCRRVATLPAEGGHLYGWIVRYILWLPDPASSSLFLREQINCLSCVAWIRVTRKCKDNEPRTETRPVLMSCSGSIPSRWSFDNIWFHFIKGFSFNHNATQ
jgi:hypothetical protein